MLHTTKWIVPGLLCALAGEAFAQSDDCPSAPLLSGTGSFVFDTTGFAQSGFEINEGCGVGANNSFSADGFFAWTVPTTGDYVFDTLSTTWDTQLAIYAGDCALTVCLGSNDDVLYPQNLSALTSAVPVTGLLVGTPVLIQIGGWNGAEGPGTINIHWDPCPSAGDDSFEPNDACSNAAPIADGTFPGLLVLDSDRDYYSLCLADGATVSLDLLFSDANGDCDLWLWDAANTQCAQDYATALASSASSTDNEGLTYTNVSGTSQDLVAEVYVWSGCNTYDLVVGGAGCIGGNVGTPFCDPMDVNSTGNSTTLTAISGSGVETGIRLEVRNGVPGEFGYFLIGNNLFDPGIISGDGRFCLDFVNGNTFARYNYGSTTNSLGIFDSAGDFQSLTGNATSNGGYGFDIPTISPLGGTIMAGQIRHIQLWHRDTPSGPGHTNFSNGLSLTF
ncbi:MAG: hypothetical protein H6830_12040 [Planctomycetes bacterium]|nr:hypothetical protein [Planctomycetota bacterium]MCB9910810.1 hypothetical protein [Planctomycetota bacterium]MCB9912258.1 hypothetical protein [Planctomycetota bacterium]HPF12785.1 hypothetical protein [Planctomycetota bacterium]